MKRLIVTALLATALATAGPVFTTAKGKSYHQKRECMSLTRAKQVYKVEESDAVAHGLKECGICSRKAKPKADNNPPAWLQGKETQR